MKESYRKGAANPPDPEPCEAGGMGADGVRLAGRQHGSVRQQREHVAALRSRRPTQLRFTALLHHVTIDLKVLNSIWGEDFLSISYVRNMTH
jgi:hypothetical protein